MFLQPTDPCPSVVELANGPIDLRQRIHSAVFPAQKRDNAAFGKKKTVKQEP
jgi:hypothetical protein